MSSASDSLVEHTFLMNMNIIVRLITAWVLGLIAFVSVSVAQSAMTNVSFRTVIRQGEPAVIGFNITTQYEWETKTLLVRAVGPGLREFGVADRPHAVTLSYFGKKDPRVLFTNSNWVLGANPDPFKWFESYQKMRSVEARVGAFPLMQGSQDAAMLLELPAGTHTITINTVGSGTVLVEVYEVPNSEKG